MKFKEALELANRNKNLIGKKFNGATIDEIIIHPSNNQQFDDFSKAYISSGNAQQSVLPYLESDLIVGVVLDKHRINRNSVFFHTNIEYVMNQKDEE